MRRYGDPPQKDKAYTNRPGVYGIIHVGPRILLTEQSEPEPEVQLPGGGIDAGESPLRALYREALEETGWSLHSPRRLGAFQRFVYMPEYDLWARKICILYACQPGLQLCEPREPGHRAFWCDMKDAIGQLGNPGDNAFLHSYWKDGAWR